MLTSSSSKDRVYREKIDPPFPQNDATAILDEKRIHGSSPSHQNRSDLYNEVTVFISKQLATGDLHVVLLPSNK